MTLTKQARPRSPDDFPTLQLFLLGKPAASSARRPSLTRTPVAAIVCLAKPIALTSIYPYAWALVKRFHIGSEQDASYSGLLISASLAEALIGMFWGGLSDRVGRKPVLMLGCGRTMLSVIMVDVVSNI